MKVLLIIILSISAMAANAAPVVWNHGVEMQSPTDGTLTISATIEPGWHIYGFEVPDGGPIPTTISLAADSALTWTSDIVVSMPPTDIIDRLFHLKLACWEGTVTFSRNFHLPQGSSATITGGVRYMACDRQRCGEPTTHHIALIVGDVNDTDRLDAVATNTDHKNVGIHSTPPDSIPIAPSVLITEAAVKISVAQYLTMVGIALVAGGLGGMIAAWIFIRRKNLKANKTKQ